MVDEFVIALFGGSLLVSLIWGSRQLSGTTLMAPWYWAAVAVLSITVTELFLDGASDQTGNLRFAPLRYLSAIFIFCPTVALLGAKRPQDRAWQWIVLSFWIVLALPAATALLYSHPTFQLGSIWSWFLLILIVISAANYLATPYWISGLLVGAAQLCLLSVQLPWIWYWAELSPGQETSRSAVMIALCLLLAAAVSVQLIARRRISPASPLSGLDRTWREFRNRYGVLWGLRVADRINRTAKRYGMNFRLHWDGFWLADEQGTPQRAAPLQEQGERIPPTAEQILISLLRRFVSDDWIDQYRTPFSEKNSHFENCD